MTSTQQALIFVPLIFAACGAVMIWFGLRSRKLAQASKSWPKATGKILRNEVRRYDHTDADNRSRYTYKVDIEYQYAVNNVTFRGNRVQFGQGLDFNTAAHANKVAARYPTGATVDVYYDPASPLQCTLDQATAGSVMALLVIGVVFLVFPPLVCGLLYMLGA